MTFSNILIDNSLPEDIAPTRKPKTGLLNQYIYGDYNLNKSYVIGDRDTDIQLAANLKAKGIKIGKQNKKAVLNTNSWQEIYQFLKQQPRTSTQSRVTSETNINLTINLDGSGKSTVDTGIEFFDHMLEQIAKHGNLDLSIKVSGDLQIDEHHTIEDVDITLGQAVRYALGI